MLNSKWTIAELLRDLPGFERLDDGVDLLACRLGGPIRNRTMYVYLYGDDPDVIHYDLEDATAATTEWDAAVERGDAGSISELRTVAKRWLLDDPMPPLDADG